MTIQPHRNIYLVQSAATSWQHEQRIQGNTDLPADEAGLGAIHAALAEFDPATPIKFIASASDEASRQTAALLHEHVKTAPKVKTYDDLVEMNLGLWQGLERSVLAERYTRAYGLWKNDPWRVEPPEGESMEVAADRVDGMLSKLIGKLDADETVAIVLRPITLALTRYRLSGIDVAESLWRENPPIIERIELDAATVRSIRTGQRRRRVSA